MSNPEQYEEQAFDLMEACPDECKRFMLQLSSENSKLKKELKEMKAFAAEVKDLLGITPEDMEVWKKPLYSDDLPVSSSLDVIVGDTRTIRPSVVRRGRSVVRRGRVFNFNQELQEENDENCLPEANC